MVKESEYNSIIEYIRTHPEGNYGDYLVHQVNSGKKAPKKKEPIGGKYKEVWSEFWNLWPSTKSVPDTQYKSGASMKKNEQKMYEKWLKAIESGKITIEKMYRAADCYLQWGYEDSKRLGRNELQYRNGMEPWLNGEVYLNYQWMEMPVKYVQKEVVQSVTDM